MNIQSLIGKKIDQTQGFLEDGTRVPVSTLMVKGNVITQIKSKDKDGYVAIQLGIDHKKKTTKQLTGHFKKAGITTTPRFLREIRLEDTEGASLNTIINPSQVFKHGDLVNVTAISKGKGFAGGVKRHHFKGGPRTHGQSDRERAPGSIGQTTTPGRVYKGKRMAGKMGNVKVTIRNLQILNVNDDIIYVKGLIPGVKGAVVMIKKVGENKKFIPLYEEKVEEVKTPSDSKDEKDKEVESESAVSEKKEKEIEVKKENSKKKKMSSDAKVMEDKKEGK